MHLNHTYLLHKVTEKVKICPASFISFALNLRWTFFYSGLFFQLKKKTKTVMSVKNTQGVLFLLFGRADYHSSLFFHLLIKLTILIAKVDFYFVAISLFSV